MDAVKLQKEDPKMLLSKENHSKAHFSIFKPTPVARPKLSGIWATQSDVALVASALAKLASASVSICFVVVVRIFWPNCWADCIGSCSDCSWMDGCVSTEVLCSFSVESVSHFSVVWCACVCV